MILGIGAGDRPLLALGLRPSRLASLAAAIDGIRQLWRGEEVDMRAVDMGAADMGAADMGAADLRPGEFSMARAHLRFPARADIPVFVSASGPKTLELAGQIADGVSLLVGLFPEALDWAISHLALGAHAVGRPRPHVAAFADGAGAT